MRRNLGRRLRPEEGYTLTEILIVIAIIGLIATVLTPGLIGHMSRARAKTAQLQLETLSAAVETFRSDVGRYPTTAEGLNALLAQPGNVEGWTGPYIKSTQALKDPWGGAITYQLDQTGLSFSVNSLGGDGVAGGEGANRDLHAPS